MIRTVIRAAIAGALVAATMTALGMGRSESAAEHRSAHRLQMEQSFVHLTALTP